MGQIGTESFRQDFFRLKNLIMPPSVSLEETPEAGRWWENRQAVSHQEGGRSFGNPKSKQGCATDRNPQSCHCTQLF